MKILHLAKYYPPTRGGMETHVSLLCEELSSKGHQVTCYAFGPVKKDTKGVCVESFKSWLKTPPFSPRLLWRLLLERNQFDIVHVHSPNPWAELCALIAKPKKVILSYHSDIVEKRGAAVYLPFQRMLLRRANAIISASSQYARTSRQLKAFLPKVTIIPYGIRLPAKADPCRVAEIRSRGASPHFLFVGRLVKYKGISNLIRAMKHSKGTLTIVGHGPLKDELARLARTLNLQERIFFAHNVKDEELPSYYEACDAFILPSINRAEGFGIVLLEAMMHAKPVISTKLSTGTDEVNIHGRTGLAIAPQSPQALAQAINTLSRDPALRKTLGAESRRNASRYTASRMTRDILAVYRRL